MKNQRLIIEELNRIKIVMKYDSSKTLTENENKEQLNEVYWWLVGGKLLSGAAIKGAIPAGAKLIGSFGSATAAQNALLAGTAGTAAGGGTAATTGTFLGLGPVGWGVLAVIGIAALGTWAYTKDADIEKVRTLFNMCVYHQDRDKWKKYLSDKEVEEKADKLFKAMDDKMFGISFGGFGIPQTDEDAIYAVMKSFESPGDFCAVSKKYEQKYKNSLIEDLDSDFDYGWDEIANPIVKMTEEYAKKQAKEFCDSDPEECAKKTVEACKKNPKLENCREILGNSEDSIDVSDIDKETNDDDEESDQDKSSNNIKNYTVAQGDNLYKIARENNTNILNILKLNPNIIDPSKIEVGQIIKLG